MPQANKIFRANRLHDTAPEQPVGLYLDGKTDTEIAFGWSLPSSNDTSILIFRDGVEIAELPAHSTYFYDSGLTPQTAYSYRVYAVNFFGESQASASLDVVTDEPHVPPAAPTGLVAIPVGPNEVGLSWNDNAADEQVYRVLRCFDDGSGNPNNEWELIADNLPPDTTTYQDTTVDANMAYWYIVSCYNLWAEAQSDPATATTPDAIPNPPSDLAAVPYDANTNQLTWVDNSTNETGFIVSRAAAIGGPYVDIETTAADVTSFNDVGLITGTMYYYKVRAVGTAGESTNSNIASAAPSGGTVALLSGLVGYWAMDNAGNIGLDSTANAFHLTNVNSVSSVVGKLGNAGSFRASPDKQLTRADAPALRFDGDFTLSIWFYQLVPQYDAGNLFCKSGELYCWRTASNNKLNLELHSSGGPIIASLTSAETVPQNQWIHIVVYRSGNTLGLVINNGAPTTTAIGAGSIGSTGLFRIGAMESGYSWTGYLDECGKWNRKLSGAEITALYNSGNGLAYANF